MEVSYNGGLFKIIHSSLLQWSIGKPWKTLLVQWFGAYLYFRKPPCLVVNGHFRNLDWRYLPYKAYFLGLNFREYPHNSYGQKYSTNEPPCIGS